MRGSKQLIAAWLSRRPCGVIAEPELRELQAELHGAAPGKKPPSLSRLAEIVHEAGAAVRFDDFGGGPEDRILSLHSLAALEQSIGQLQQHLLAAQRAQDLEAVQRSRLAARRTRRRSLWIANNTRVAATKRALKQEMADWLLVWLEMPDAFFEWLPLRKRTEEFQRLQAAEEEQQHAANSQQEAGKC